MRNCHLPMRKKHKRIEWAQTDCVLQVLDSVLCVADTVFGSTSPCPTYCNVGVGSDCLIQKGRTLFIAFDNESQCVSGKGEDPRVISIQTNSLPRHSFGLCYICGTVRIPRHGLPRDATEGLGCIGDG